MSIQDNVKDWVTVDNRIKSLSEQLKDLRNTKKTYEDNMVTWANSNTADDGSGRPIQRPVIRISDGKLRFVETRQTAPLSLKYVEQRLKILLENSTPNASEMVALIMKDLKEHRETKVVQEVKRVYDK
jgi:hypothetical protein